MTKRHFIAAARFIKLYVEAGQLVEASAAAALIIAMNDNPNFNKPKFLDACGLKPAGV